MVRIGEGYRLGEELVLGTGEPQFARSCHTWEPVRADQAVKSRGNAILDSLVAGEAVRVSGLGTFDVAARPAREGRNPQSGETIKIAASKAVRFHPLNPPKAAPHKKSAPRKKPAVRK